ncbi:MAG: transporter substrate-binding domain-containing protein [Acutalibacteraceae bacterium]|nr:transporter substrate-binding domain-containing protein [Oscillospiraceae bacterium]
MKKLVSIVLAALLIFSFAACSNNGTTDTESQNQSGVAKIADAKSIADLQGMKIAAQQGTFHEQALSQIKDVQKSTYPKFADLLVALKSGAIDGYISEEPTALAETLNDSTLTYLPFENNTTGFTAGKEDVGIAIAVKKGSDIKDKIDSVLSEIPEETKKALMEQMVKLANGQDIGEIVLKSDAPETTTGTLKVGMECAYKPFNWSETSASVGAVPISGEGKEGLYTNGYDVQIAQYVANKLGLKLEIYSIKWESLIPSVNSGTVDAVVAGMSPTAERAKEVDFSQTYYESNLVVIIKK